MMIVAYLLNILIFQCSCQIDFENNVKIQKSQCDHQDNKEIEAQINYLQIIQFFKYDYYYALNYLDIIQTNIEQLQNDMKNDRQKLSNFLEQFKKKIYVIPLVEFEQLSSENINHHDNRVQQAYRQLLDINNFVNLFKKSVQFLEFKIQPSYYHDLFDGFYYNKYENYDKVEDKIKLLKQNYYTCTRLNFNVELIKIPSKTSSYEQVDKHSISVLKIPANLINSNPISRDVVDNLKKFEDEIKIEDCPQKIISIQNQHQKFKQLFELSEFKLNYTNQSIEGLQQFIEQSDQFIIDSLPIKKIISGFQISEEIGIKSKELRELLADKKVQDVFWIEFAHDYNTAYDIWSDKAYPYQPELSFRGYLSYRFDTYTQMENYIDLIKHSIQFFSLDTQYFKGLQLSLNSLMSYIQKFSFSRDYIQKKIEYFERDISRCQVEIQKLKLEKQCQNIDQKIYQYQQANELLSFRKQTKYYDLILKTISSQELFGPFEQLDKYSQIFDIQEKTYYVQVYSAHLNPEDQEAVQAYENLIELQNLLVFLQNAFSKAEELLDFDINIINSYEIEYQNLKKNIYDKIYLQNYSERKINEQLSNLSNDQELCSKDNKHYQIFLKDNSDINYYYWFEKQFKPQHPLKLLILPNNVELFDKEDITNYEGLTQECLADIEGLVEDIIETLKIIELLKYQEQGRNQYNKLIHEALSFQKDFRQQTKKLFFAMENLNLSQKLRYFNRIKNQSIDKELQAKFNSLHKINDKLGILFQETKFLKGHFFYSYQNSRDLLKFNNQDFNRMNTKKQLIEEYFMKQRYQLQDKQMELQELYHQYKSCTGQDFLYDFCESYKEQNIYGGICQYDCIKEPKKIDSLQLDIKITNPISKKRTPKLNGQKKQHLKKNKSRSNHKKFN